MSHSFFLSPLVFLTSVSQFVKLLRFLSLCYEILIVVLSLFFFSAVTSAFQLFTCKLCLQFSGLRVRNFREIDFLLKTCWSIPCFHPSWKVHTWIHPCAMVESTFFLSLSFSHSAGHAAFPSPCRHKAYFPSNSSQWLYKICKRHPKQ